jgi:hypothetical protein
MRLRSEPLQLRDFVLGAVWLAVKLVIGLVIAAALFETVGVVVVGLTNLVTYPGLTASAHSRESRQWRSMDAC